MAGSNRSLKSLRRALSNLLGDVRGATAIEYGLIAALIVIAMVASLGRVANVTTKMWDDVNSKVTNPR